MSRRRTPVRCTRDRWGMARYGPPGLFAAVLLFAAACGDLLGAEPGVIRVEFSPQSHRADVYQRIAMQVKLRQIAGAVIGDPFDVVLPDGREQALGLSAEGPATVAADLRFDRPGVHCRRVRVHSPAGNLTHDLETSVIVGEGERLRLTPVIRTDRVRLDFVPAAAGKQMGAARWAIADRPTEWKLAGWLLPLVELAVQGEDGRTVRRRPSLTLLDHSDRAARLSAAVEDLAHWHVELDLEVVQSEEKAGLQAILVTARLFGPKGGRLLDFSGPMLRADRERAPDLLDRFGLFGGLEFLEPGWRSSSDRAVGEKSADRWSPHPFKVTIPVMAIEAGGLTSAVMWQPLDRWDGTEAMPTATFASPNFLDDQPNHLMRLSVPTIPRWREENESLAREPYVVSESGPLTLRYLLYAETDLPVGMTCRRWYELFGPPTPPPTTHADRALYELLARHYGETMYWPEEKGWRLHWYLDKKSFFIGFMAAELIAHAAETGDKRWLERTGLTNKAIIDVAGTLAGELQNDQPARRQLAAMRPDGTWPFINTEQMRDRTRQHTQGKHDSLGEDGSTSLGTCAQAALPILRHALLTGEEKYISASLAALEAMRRFRIPRGAQVWEVHKDIPDIRAAALAVEAYHIGYRLTGEGRWLDEASYWAWTGVPFVYSWRVPIERTEGQIIASRDRNDWNRLSMPLSEGFQKPDRQVTPFATVPVLGPTFYVMNWFGVIVQWCGLEWAWKVLELDSDRPDPLLRYIADGVVASGLQQMFDRPPWVGLYPDVWDPQSNTARGAFICALLPMRCLQAQGRLPRWTRTWTRVIRDRDGRARWHASGWGEPVKLPPPIGAGSWQATVAFLPGQPNELMLAGVAKPVRVRVARELLDPRADRESAAAAGWTYHADRRAVVIRFLQPQKRAEVRIDW